VTSGELPGRHFSAEEKIRTVLDGLRGEDNIAALCRKEGIARDLSYRWSKEFLEACKKRLAEKGQVDFRAMKKRLWMTTYSSSVMTTLHSLVPRFSNECDAVAGCTPAPPAFNFESWNFPSGEWSRAAQSVTK
jgi:transposase-like protein